MANVKETGSEQIQEARNVSDVLQNNAHNQANGMEEPLLVEEYPKMSAPMRNLMSSLENLTVQEIVIGVLQILIVESGFVPFSSDPLPGDESCRYNARRLKNYFPSFSKNSDGVFIAHFVLSPYPDVKCKLVCVPTGNDFIVNMNCSCDGKTFGVSVSPAKYVSFYSGQVTFKRLKSLSFYFKNQVVIPTRTAILNAVHQTSVGLFALPVEVLLNFVEYLKVKDFLNWTSTCKYLNYTFGYDEHIWKRYCNLSDFKQDESDGKQIYREYFKRKFTARNRISRQFSDFGHMSPFRPRLDPRIRPGFGVFFLNPFNNWR